MAHIPSTQNYQFPYEALTDPPGETLNGGLTGAHEILAESVDRELNRVETTQGAAIQDVANDLADFQTEYNMDALRTIAIIDTGAGTNTTEFTAIPQTFRDLVLTWKGVSDGAGEIDACVLRFNGDAGANYNWRRNRNTAAAAYLSEEGTTTTIHVGYVGTLNSQGTVYIQNYAGTTTKMAHGTSFSKGQSGGLNTFFTTSGGIWNSTAAISAIRIFPSGQLWDINPKMTLYGVPHGV